jgi:hypothetical protein
MQFQSSLALPYLNLYELQKLKCYLKIKEFNFYNVNIPKKFHVVTTQKLIMLFLLP